MKGEICIACKRPMMNSNHRNHLGEPIHCKCDKSEANVSTFFLEWNKVIEQL